MIRLGFLLDKNVFIVYNTKSNVNKKEKIMKKQTFKRILSFLLLTAMLMSLPLYVGADETEENPSLDMAYNIYSNPVLPRENAFDTFVIEMRSDLDPDCTYWSLANFQLHISDQTKALYRDIEGGHVYAGLQHSGGARRAIMAFWEIGRAHV